MPSRKIPLSRRSHITGAQPLAPGMAMIGHESALERDFVLLQRLDGNVLAVEEQPVTITWKDDARQARQYTPDYRVVRRSGAEIVEVKYRQDLHENWRLYRPRFIAARDWAKAQGMGFHIATERGIRTPRLLNAKKLIPRMHDHVAPAMEARILQLAAQHGPVPFMRLTEAVSGPDHPMVEVLAAMWALLAKRCLHADLDKPITGHTIVSALWPRS